MRNIFFLITAIALGVLGAPDAGAQEQPQRQAREDGPPTYLFKGPRQTVRYPPGDRRPAPEEREAPAAGAQPPPEPEMSAKPDGRRLGRERAPLSRGVPLHISPADIRLIQLTLNRAGYHAGHVDGALSAATRTALRNFQQARGLEPTGNVNLRTIAALDLMGVIAAGLQQRSEPVAVHAAGAVRQPEQQPK